MQTTYRLFVKTTKPSTDAQGKDVPAGTVLHTENSVDAAQVYSTMRELEKKFPGSRIQSKQLDPLSM